MKLSIVLTTAAITAALATGAAHAKGHDQSGTETPGESVGSVTVSGAQGLGASKGGKGPMGTPGKSADAGKK